MKTFLLVGLNGISPVFSCKVQAESLADAGRAVRSSLLDPTQTTMRYDVAVAAVKIFAGREHRMLSFVHSRSCAEAIASCARASVPGCDAAMIERVLAKCTHVFLGEGPSSAA